MKKKSIFLISALSLLAISAIGVGASLKANKEVKVAEAAVTSYEYEIRYSRGDWGDVAPVIYTWEDDVEAVEYDMTYLFGNEYSQAVYCWTPSALEPLYSKMIIKSKGSWSHQTNNIDSPTTPGIYNYYGEGGSTGCNTVSKMKIYLYDYDGAFSGGAVYAHVTRNLATKLVFDDGLGIPMTAENDLTGNGRVYSAEVSNAIDRVTFQNAGKTITTGEVSGSNANYAYVYAPVSSLDGEGNWWDNINYVYAHNWAMNLLNFRTYSKAAGAELDTGTCETNYFTAKTAYNYYKLHNNDVLNEIKNGFGDSLERMSHWAVHNGESFVVTEGIGTFSSRVVSTASSIEADNTALIVIVASLFSVAAISAYFLLKRKEK